MARCPECKQVIPGTVTMCCPKCLEKRRAAFVRPPATASEGDERPAERVPFERPQGKYIPPASRAVRPNSAGRRVFKNEKGQG